MVCLVEFSSASLFCTWTRLIFVPNFYFYFPECRVSFSTLKIYNLSSVSTVALQIGDIIFYALHHFCCFFLSLCCRIIGKLFCYAFMILLFLYFFSGYYASTDIKCIQVMEIQLTSTVTAIEISFEPICGLQ
jgi:hypothetical protein